MKKLYLDIDGVLLQAKNPCAAEYTEEFIDYITSNFDCYWLTTHCKGTTTTVIQYLSKYFSNEVVNKLRCIKATNWDSIKTETLNFDEDFYWLDDYPLRAEIEILNQHKCEKRCIVVNLNQANELKHIIEKLADIA